VIKLLDKTLTISCAKCPDFAVPVTPLPNAKKIYDGAIERLSRSEKAKGFIKLVEESKHLVLVLVSDDYESKFFSPNELIKWYRLDLGSGACLVTWSPMSKQTWVAKQEHQPKDWNIPGTHPSIQNKIRDFDSAIILLHEFGHAIQYMKEEVMYETLRQLTYTRGERDADGAGHDIDFDEKIEDDNIMRHEAPVCLELNWQVRWRYWDQRGIKRPT
jgi:hypothetical protein